MKTQRSLKYIIYIYKWKWKPLSRVWLFVTPRTVQSMELNNGVGSCSLLQGIFPTQGSNPGLPHCRWILYQLSYRGSPRKWQPSPVPSPVFLLGKFHGQRSLVASPWGVCSWLSMHTAQEQETSGVHILVITALLFVDWENKNNWQACSSWEGVWVCARVCVRMCVLPCLPKTGSFLLAFLSYGALFSKVFWKHGSS